MIRKISPIVIIGAVLIAGVAIAATTIVYFENTQTGVYKGPGVPIVKDYSFTVNSNDSYYAIPVFLNTTGSYYINESVTSANIGNSGFTNQGQVVGLMNQSQYDNFTANNSMNFLITANSVLAFNYHGSGKQTVYVIYLNELSVPSDYINTILSVMVVQS